MKYLAPALLALSVALTACSAATTEPVATEDRGPIGKADLVGSCAAPDDEPDFCGGPSDGNCWCDESCEFFGDCCSDKPSVCDGEPAPFCSEGEIVVTQVFSAANDGKECATDTEHCLTSDFGACPQFAPLPPDFCEDGDIIVGEPSFVSSADGMECEIPSIHCVTRDHGACPQFAPPPSDWCNDGQVVIGPASFIPSADGMECQLPSLRCLSTDPGACEDPEFCEEGTVVTVVEFESGDDAFSCTQDVQHCVTHDGFACPQLAPLPPDFCSEGHVVAGEPSFISSADGMECQMPSVHCVTNDGSACPQFAPLPPDFCEDGQIMQGPSSFISSADGMECEMPSVHCVALDEPACL